jgi:hypothetical protein
VDSVGSHTLANALAMTRYGGAVAACGLAQGMDLPGSVAPFILRGVSLLGVDSVMAPVALRAEAWSRLARELDRGKLARMTTTVPLEGRRRGGPAHRGRRRARPHRRRDRLTRGAPVRGRSGASGLPGAEEPGRGAARWTGWRLGRSLCGDERHSLGGRGR